MALCLQPFQSSVRTGTVDGHVFWALPVDCADKWLCMFQAFIIIKAEVQTLVAVITLYGFFGGQSSGIYLFVCMCFFLAVPWERCAYTEHANFVVELRLSFFRRAGFVIPRVL